MGVKIERIVDGTDFQLGEGPHWDAATQSLYFVDIYNKSIHKYDPKTKSCSSASNGGDDSVSFIIPVEGATNKFVISLGSKIVEISWDGKSEKYEVIKTLGDTGGSTDTLSIRLNDAKCDSFGKLWAGTMGVESVGKVKDKAGALFSLDGINKLKNCESGITIANGLAWSSDNTKMYYIDTVTSTVDQFDYDKTTGISNRKPIFSFEKAGVAGLPDGMTIDSDGNLWVACFNGSCMIKIDPRKPNTLLETIKMPALQVTSAIFGGANYDELYVTTARISFEAGTAPSPPENGATYRITGLGVKGLPSVNFKSL